MFIPSMYKSVQVVDFTANALTAFPLDVVIPIAVVANYTRIGLQGWASGDATGFVPADNCKYTLINSTTIRVFNVGRISGAFTFTGTFTVEEYIPFFLRQAITYGDGNIPWDQTFVDIVMSGMSALGPKAFVKHLGSSCATSSEQIEADEVNTRVKLDIPSKTVRISRLGVFDNSSASDVLTNFMVVDPK